MFISNLDRISSNSGWEAHLHLGFIKENDRTSIQNRKHFGPLQIQKPFYPDTDGTCHVYVLHPPGGVVGGDRFDIRIDLEPNAKTLITTPAAGKFYRSGGPIAFQNQKIKIATQGILEWFPSENIFFSGAKAKIKTTVDLTKESHFIGWDIGCFGRPACGERFNQGSLDHRFEIRLQGKLLHLERLLVKGNDPMLDAKWGLLEKPVVGKLICVTPRKDLVDLLRKNIQPPGNGNFFSVTFLDGIILCRYLGNSVEQAKHFFIKAWQVMRFTLRGRQAVIPRIWST